MRKNHKTNMKIGRVPNRDATVMPRECHSWRQGSVTHNAKGVLWPVSREYWYGSKNKNKI